jgi:hypothetical protein
MINSPSVRINPIVTACLATIKQSDPDQVLKESTWFDKWTGKDVVNSFVFAKGANEIDGLIVKAKDICTNLEDIVSELVMLIEETKKHNLDLETTLDACDSIKKSGFVFDCSYDQERFDSRRINLRMLWKSNQLSIVSFEQQQQNIKTIICKFNDVYTIVLPIWKQHAIHYELNRNFTPDVGKQLKMAHQHVSQQLNEINTLLN